MQIECKYVRKKLTGSVSQKLFSDWHESCHRHKLEFRKSLFIKHLRVGGGRGRVSRWYSSTYVTYSAMCHVACCFACDLSSNRKPVRVSNVRISETTRIAKMSEAFISLTFVSLSFALTVQAVRGREFRLRYCRDD